MRKTITRMFAKLADVRGLLSGLGTPDGLLAGAARKLMLDALDNDNGAMARVAVFIGAKRDICDRFGQPILCRAARAGHGKCMGVLLESGFDPNARGSKGWTPLHFAALKGHVECIVALMAAGADPRLTDDNGWTPAYVATRENRPEPIAVMAKEGSSNPLPGLSECIILACHKGFDDTAKALILAGADPNTRDASGIPLLHMAASAGNLPMCLGLIKAGANPGAIEPIFNSTASKAASFEGHQAVASAIDSIVMTIELKGIENGSAANVSNSI